MKRLVLLAGLLAALAAPVAASAHPLGNFTVNRFSRVESADGRIYVRYVLDMAEIPTYQAGRIDAAAYARRIARGAHLSVDGSRAPLVAVRHALAHPDGAAGLKTTRLEVILRGPRVHGSVRIDYRDTNYAGRIGWKEIVVGDAASSSAELRAYPKNELRSPLDVTSVATTLAAGDGAPPMLSSGSSLRAPDRVADSGFAKLIGRGNLSWLVILTSLAVALFWGAVHALSPGHGKTIVTAYLVGQRGTPRHALLLGLITTVTHTAGVFALGAVTLALAQFIVPGDLYPWINVLSGLLVVGIGVSVLTGRWQKMRRHARDHAHGHDHDHGHDHHGHDHAETPQGIRGIVAVGISGGLLPCPSALVVLLAAVSLHRVAFGLLLILAFSVGLAAAIAGIGLVAVLAKWAFSRFTMEGRVIGLLPTASAAVIVVAGILMTLRALPSVG